MEKENIKIRKKEFELSKKIQITGDILVPDTKPDIINIIGTNGIEIIKKIDVSDSRIRFDGCWNGTVIYLSDLGETKSLNINLDFSDVVENEIIKSNDDIEYAINKNNIDVRILNERKISVEINLEVIVYDYKIEDIEIISKLDDSDDIQKLEKYITVKEFVNSAVTKTSANDDVNFLEQGKNVEILDKDIYVSNVEKKISYNKILAKAEADIEILYLCDSEIKKFKTGIPIMSFLEIENANEENLIDLNYDIRNFIVNNNVYEKGMLHVDIEYEVSCNVYNKKQITIIEDLYSLNRDIKYSKKDIVLECLDNCDNEIFEYTENLGIDDLKDIYNYKYYLKQVNSTGSNSVECALVLDICYSKKENNSLIQKNIEFPFILKSSTSFKKLKIEKCEIKSVNEEYICVFKIECIENEKTENIALLNECEFVNCENKENYSMIIYFVKPNDTIWNIAKSFKVSQDKLLKLNNLSTPESIMPGEKLYIMRG